MNEKVAAPDTAVIELAQALIRRPSITPQDGGCQGLIAEYLAPLGFRPEWLPFGEVCNVWLQHGDGDPLIVFAGHTDVVPPGPEHLWTHPPYTAQIRDDMLWGRGAADMKGSVAAMVEACADFVRQHPDHPGSVALLLTSDEEGPAVDGTRRVVEHIAHQGRKIDYCIVGEPSSMQQFGDTLRIGRRGSLTGHLHIRGQQGHVAYPERANNPIHAFAPAMADMVARHWDAGNEHFPPTSFQLSNIEAGTGADNVIPAELRAVFNLRFSTASTADGLKAALREILDQYEMDYTIHWHLGAEPFMTEPGRLTECMAAAVTAVTGLKPAYSTAGGTSDARFIAPTGADVIEFGPMNTTIHQIDEHIALDDLIGSMQIYRDVLGRLLLD